MRSASSPRRSSTCRVRIPSGQIRRSIVIMRSQPLQFKPWVDPVVTAAPQVADLPLQWLPAYVNSYPKAHARAMLGCPQCIHRGQGQQLQPAHTVAHPSPSLLLLGTQARRWERWRWRGCSPTWRSRWHRWCAKAPATPHPCPRRPHPIELGGGEFLGVWGRWSTYTLESVRNVYLSI
jgi:hypothetical protein